MKKTLIALNAAALVVALGCIAHDSIFGSLNVQMVLTDLDRSEVFNEAKADQYTKAKFGKAVGVRSTEFASLFLGPVQSYSSATQVGLILLPLMNILMACAMPAQRSRAPSLP